MSKWQKVLFSDFLTERKNRFKPKDVIALGLKRVDKINFSAEIFISDKPTNTDMILVKKGDLLISGINAEKGAIAVYEGDEDVLASIHYSSYQFDKRKINIDYLKWFLISDAFRNLLKEQSGGGIKTELKAKHILPLQINLPDLETQKEIVKTISLRDKNYSEFFSELTAQQTLITQLRQSILQEAVQGKLNAEFRSSHPELAEGSHHASELLKRIKAEKEKLIKQGKLKKEKPLPPIYENEIPYQLPEGWAWCRLGELIELISGQHIEAGDYNTNKIGVPYLTGPSDFGKTFPVFSRWSLKPKVTAKKNDILITVKGSGVGKLNYLHVDGVAIGRQLMAIRTRDVLKEYIFIFLESIFEQLQDEKMGIAIPGISREDILEKSFPLPPILEQKRIVEKVNQLIQYCNELEQQVEQSINHAQQLMQAVLREAFEDNENKTFVKSEISEAIKN